MKNHFAILNIKHTNVGSQAEEPPARGQQGEES